MKKTVVSAAIAVVLVAGQWAHGQFAPTAGPRFYAEFKPVVGGWSEYQVTKKGEAPLRMKIAVVGREGNAYWYEATAATADGRTITQALVSGNPEDEKNVERMIVKTDDEPAMEMPQIPLTPEGGARTRGSSPDGPEALAG